MNTPLDALNRARQAWEATQPQLVLDGWADALDDTVTLGGGGGVVERVPARGLGEARRTGGNTSLVGSSASPSPTGLERCGTEPHSDTSADRISHRVAPIRLPLMPRGSVGAAPTSDGPARSLGERMRGRGQGGE